MSEKHEAPKFNVVFNGRYVRDREPGEVKAEFARRFGETNARKVFGQSSVIIKRDLSHEQAGKYQRILTHMGMLIELVAADSAKVSERPLEPMKIGDMKTGPGKTAPQTANTSESAISIPASAETKAEPTQTPDSSSAAKPGKPQRTVYTKAELDAAFKGSTKKPPGSKLYLLTLFPVTLLMLLLPLVYIAITLLSGYSVYWLATSGQALFFGTYTASYVSLIAYPASIIGAALLTIFLARPLLSHAYRQPQPVRLDPQREPALFHLVKRITDESGASMPHEILLDTQVNASAMLSRGIFSRTLTLTIGLPLFYGFNVQTLAGILAHEFGHFSQHFGMRAQYIISHVNYWFYRKTHEPDNWDEYVEEMFESEYQIIIYAALFAKVGSWFCRLVLYTLAYIAKIFSLSLSRQMEFDADRYEIALTGSTQYRTTAIELRVLSAGHYSAVQDLSAAFDSGKLADNLPKYAALKAAAYSETERREFANSIEQTNSNVFDTHPADQARIKKAERSQTEAQFSLTQPASHLLADIERLSRLATLQWYRSYGLTLSLDDLIPMDDIKQEQDTELRVGAAGGDYFAPYEGFYQRLPLSMSRKYTELTQEQLQEDLKKQIGELKRSQTKFIKANRTLLAHQNNIYKYKQALFWLRCGFSINPADFALSSADSNSIETKLSTIQAQEAELKKVLDQCLQLQGERLSIGLELVARQSPEQGDEIKKLKRAYRVIASGQADIDALNESNFIMYLQLEALADRPDKVSFQSDLRYETNRNKQLQSKLYRVLDREKDPYAENKSLAQALNSTHSEDLGSEELAAQSEALRFMRQFHRIADKIEGRLAEIAAAIEADIIQ